MSNELSIHDALLLGYRAFGGTMNGKTLLQKRIYFLSVMLGIDMGYEAHYYGPYSAQIAFLNAELKSLGYISESTSKWGYDQRGFEMARHDFGLTELGQRITDRKAIRHPDWWKKIEKAAAVAKQAGDLDYVELSIAAKAYYVLTKLNGKTTTEDMAAMLPRFGWNVTDDQLNKAKEFLVKMRLVEKHSAGRSASGN